MACVDLLAKLGVPWLHSLKSETEEKQSSSLVPENDNLYKQCSQDSKKDFIVFHCFRETFLYSLVSENDMDIISLHHIVPQTLKR